MATWTPASASTPPPLQNTQGTKRSVRLRRRHNWSLRGGCWGEREGALTAADGGERGGDLGARGEVEIPTEEHEDEPEPDGRRGHRPVVSDGHRGRRRRCRNSDLRLWIQLPASAEAEKGMAKVLTGGGCLEAAEKAERLGPSAAAESGAARGGPVAMVSRDGPAGSRPRWAGWEEAGVQLSRSGSGLGSLG